MNKLLLILGLIILAPIGTGAIALLGYNWFIQPPFNLPDLTVAHMVGMASIVALFSHIDTGEEKLTSMDSVVVLLIRWLIVLLYMSIASQFV